MIAMQKWLAIVRFAFPEGTTRESEIEVDAETAQQAREIAAHMGRAMTKHQNVADPNGVDYFDAVLMVRKKPDRVKR